jgi:hypothetical protein
MDDKNGKKHSAEGSALGFWYQSLYALLILIEQASDDAMVGIEMLDDITLTANGEDLLYQLKHSIASKPSPVGIKSRSLWRTIKVWLDILPKISLSEASLHLVTVGGIVKGDALEVLTVADNHSDREALACAMAEEAQRVLDARAKAKADGETSLPYADRKDGCEAFLTISKSVQLNLMRRVTLKIDSPTAGDIEGHLETRLTLFPVEHRALIAKKLIEWWDRQIVYSLCGKRERVVSRHELQAQISEIVGEMERSKLSADFETLQKPLDYQPNGMLTRQIALVKGGNLDVDKAIREEWRARAQRARWATENPALASMINDYDAVLTEHWSDKHSQMVQDCDALEEVEKCNSGLDLLRWSHNDAPTAVRPIQEGFGAVYYVRGSYQVLAIDLQVGWHPNYKNLLKDGE